MNRDYIKSIKKIKGWENLTEDEALVINSELERFVEILIIGLPPERLDKAIDEIERTKYRNRDENVDIKSQND